MEVSVLTTSIFKGVYWEILPKGRYFSKQTRGQISDTYPCFINAMMQIGKEPPQNHYFHADAERIAVGMYWEIHPPGP